MDLKMLPFRLGQALVRRWLLNLDPSPFQSFTPATLAQTLDVSGGSANDET
jgi:hypothetical protein